VAPAVVLALEVARLLLQAGQAVALLGPMPE